MGNKACRYDTGAEAQTSGGHRPEIAPEGKKTRQDIRQSSRMLTAAAETGVVEVSRWALRLTYSSHISSEQLGGRFSRRGVRRRKKSRRSVFCMGSGETLADSYKS